MKNEKNYVGFHIPKVWQFLNIEDFAFMGIFASEIAQCSLLQPNDSLIDLDDA